MIKYTLPFILYIFCSFPAFANTISVPDAVNYIFESFFPPHIKTKQDDRNLIVELHGDEISLFIEEKNIVNAEQLKSHQKFMYKIFTYHFEGTVKKQRKNVSQFVELLNEKKFRRAQDTIDDVDFNNYDYNIFHRVDNFEAIRFLVENNINSNELKKARKSHIISLASKLDDFQYISDNIFNLNDIDKEISAPAFFHIDANLLGELSSKALISINKGDQYKNHIFCYNLRQDIDALRKYILNIADLLSQEEFNWNSTCDFDIGVRIPALSAVSLFHSASIDAIELVNIILKGGANINFQDYKGNTALHYSSAVYEHDFRSLTILEKVKMNSGDGSKTTQPMLRKLKYIQHLEDNNANRMIENLEGILALSDKKIIRIEQNLISDRI